jgi:GR25 family glycosyltransferase involved in LPS biosynthesis
MGRTESLHLLSEAREVFVDGHFAATLLVALSFIEHTMVEELQELGHVTGSPTFSEALTISAAKLVFPADWLVRARTLSLRRNPFVHLKPAHQKHGLGVRVIEENRHPKTILEEDAKDSIDLMYNFFRATLRPAA